MAATSQPLAASAPPGSAAPSRHEPITTVPLRHPWRWVSGVIVGLLTASLILAFAQNPAIDWPTVGEYLFAPLTLQGLATTIYLTIAAMVIGLGGGIVVAVMRLSPNPVLRVVSGLFVWVFRGTPVLLQLIFWGFIGAFLPKIVLGIPFTSIEFWSIETSMLIPATVAALLALGLNEMAYASEIVRAGILSVDHGQTEAAYSLGMSPARTMRRIILPQAMRVIVPPMGNEVITMLKTTALVSVIAGRDLMSNLQMAYAQNFKIIPLLVVAAIWYLALTSILAIPQAWLERRYGRGVAGARESAVGRILRSWKDGKK
ncbi:MULTISPECIES: amino acid ABC transporter permease [Microbacterium]|uniref:amino acid ABC transporter permease n=1 Tax=Microbacterium TaxID=33882 RepID=UPI00146B1AB7|nr:MULTISPECIES: amino acid ABC transporter permease [Microbacterium]